MYQFLYKKLAAHTRYPDIPLKQQKLTKCNMAKGHSFAYGPFIAQVGLNRNSLELSPVLSFRKLD